jgi:hypothetical protein
VPGAKSVDRDLPPWRRSMMDLFFLAIIAALFLFSLWMIRAFDRM